MFNYQLYQYTSFQLPFREVLDLETIDFLALREYNPDNKPDYTLGHREL